MGEKEGEEEEKEMVEEEQGGLMALAGAARPSVRPGPSAHGFPLSVSRPLRERGTG